MRPPHRGSFEASVTAAQLHTAIVKGTEGPLQQLAQANEQTWLLIGAVAEQLSDTTKALAAYENALKHNPLSVSALTQVAGIARSKEEFGKAIDFYQRTLNISQENGEVWGSLGHCYLMMDDLQKAYTAYQQALYRLPNPKDSKLWYGIGILYDRYGSLEHAEEAFSSVLRMEPHFEKANEIYFRLGIIYKQQHKYPASLECFRYILNNPPRPLTEVDIWFQIGHVFEQQKDYTAAKEAYERVLHDNPNHAKVLQQLGWLYHQSGASFVDQDTAISYLMKSLESDPADPHSWYLLGRAFIGGQKFNKAYEAYQQAVYRDGRNPTFWCSIGVLYYQINQYRDALDAYSRAIRLNPYISEVWFNLGSLYESCNNQVNDAIDAYARASDLDPNNTIIKTRLALLRNAQRDGQPLPAPPPPQDVHPTAYASTVGGRAFPPQGGLGSQALYETGPGSGQGKDGQPVVNGRDLAAPPTRPSSNSMQESAFRGGGGPPPLQLDDGRAASSRQLALAPMSMDRKPPAEINQTRVTMQPDSADRRRRHMSPPSNVPSGYSRSENYSRNGPAAPEWDNRRRDLWDDREAREVRDARARRNSKTDRVVSGNPQSHRASPAPSMTRESPSLLAARHNGQPWDHRQDMERGGSIRDSSGRKISIGSDYRGAGPLHSLGRRGSLSRGEAEHGVRAESPGGRYGQDPREPQKLGRDESIWRDLEMRREGQERKQRSDEGTEYPTQGATPQRLETSNLRSPPSMGSDPKKKRKGRAGSMDKELPPRGHVVIPREKRTPSGTLNSPASMEHHEGLDTQTRNLALRQESPINAKTASQSSKVTVPPRRSGRVIDEDYDEGAADALMGLAGYASTKEANGTSYVPIQRLSPEKAKLVEPGHGHGHKRTISHTEMKDDPEPKKARLNSPGVETQKEASLAPEQTPVQETAVVSEKSEGMARAQVQTMEESSTATLAKVDGNDSSKPAEPIAASTMLEPVSPRQDVVMEAVNETPVKIQKSAPGAASPSMEYHHASKTTGTISNGSNGNHIEPNALSPVTVKESQGVEESKKGEENAKSENQASGIASDALANKEGETKESNGGVGI